MLNCYDETRWNKTLCVGSKDVAGRDKTLCVGSKDVAGRDNTMCVRSKKSRDGTIRCVYTVYA